MALTDSFPGASGAVDSTELRKNLAGLIVRDTAGVPRAGIFPRHTNALVTARADMALDVGAFDGVSVRGGGPLFMANDGVAQSPALATAPASNSRIDVLYFKQNEDGYGGFADGVNTPVFGVATGTAAASPTKPSIAGIAGATELATITIPSTATATNSSGVVITQTFQYTTATGGAILFRTSAARDLYLTATVGQHAYSIDALSEAVWNGTGWKVAIEDTGWVTLALASGVTTSGGLTPAVRRVNGVVHNRGQVTSSSTGALYTVPAGFVISQAARFPTMGGTSGTVVSVLVVSTDGSVSTAGNTLVNTVLSWPVG